MSKELPYFKFYPSEWIMGNISFENFSVQGLFINACCHYWHQKCDVKTKSFSKVLGKKNVNKLFSLGFISEKNDRICIEFLDEQYSELLDIHKKRVNNGRKGGLSRAKAELKPSSSIKEEDKEEEEEEDKNKEKNNKKDIFERENEFRYQSNKFQDRFDLKMIEEFCDYWTESNPNGKKMKFEMNKTFDIGRRLATWNKNNFKKPNYGTAANQQQTRLAQHLGTTDEELREAWYQQNANDNRWPET